MDEDRDVTSMIALLGKELHVNRWDFQSSWSFFDGAWEGHPKMAGGGHIAGSRLRPCAKVAKSLVDFQHLGSPETIVGFVNSSPPNSVKKLTSKKRLKSNKNIPKKLLPPPFFFFFLRLLGEAGNVADRLAVVAGDLVRLGEVRHKDPHCVGKLGLHGPGV